MQVSRKREAAHRAAPITVPCRIGLVSDTHGWLDPALAEHFAGCALILHAGDVGSAEVLEGLAAVAPVVAVRGNIDHGALFDLPLVAKVEAGPLRIAVLHIAGRPDRPNADAAALLSRPGHRAADLLLTGHSHIPVAGMVGKTAWVNPGAAGHHGFHQMRTAFRLDLDAAGEMQLHRIELGPRGRNPGRRLGDTTRK